MSLKDNLWERSTINLDFLFLTSILVGYVISSALPNIFGLESRDFSITYRFLMFIFSIIILTKNGLFRRIDLKTGLIFCVFWFFYFFKTVYSFHTDYYLPQFISHEYEIYIRILIINLLACLSLLSIDYIKVDYKLLIKSIFWILFVMLSLNLLYTLFYLNKYNNVSGIFSVYYISSGHFGASLVILSLYLLFFRTKLDTVITKQVLVLAVLLGLFAVYISAARSPVLALIIVNLYFLILKKKIKFLVYFFLFLLLSVFFLYISRQILHLDSAFIERNYLWIFEGNTSGREPYLIRAVSIFRDNIIIGGRVLYEDGLHPHNIFLELLMVGGLVLLLLFGLLFYPLLRNLGYFFKTSTANFYILPLFAIWVQYFILTLTSNNIHSNPEFWYFGSVIIGISIKNHNEKT
jgi:hypothetical protein